jgi:hypothetical protein
MSQYASIHEPQPLIITRPANTIAYATGDVFGTSAATEFEWPNFIPGGTDGFLVGLMVASNSNNTTGTGLRIHFFKTSPSLGLNDNDPLVVTDSNALNRIGMVELPAHRTGGAGSNAAVSEVRSPDVAPMAIPNLDGTRSVWIVIETMGARAGVSGETLSIIARVLRN